MQRFKNIGIIKNEAIFVPKLVDEFEQTIAHLKEGQDWSKDIIIELFYKMIPGFDHKETGKYLDSKM